MKTITLYTKPDCPLCEKAEAVLHELQREIPFRLEKIDITRDERLFELYRYEIPVIAINGQEVCRYCVDKESLRAVLKKAR
ncbi:MAG: glutaredoxin family protein [Candidatus Bipolaricaulota bacterium]|nr:glutaredoxin family protein [Candidatus Bipolaricaulota bacterium]MCS7273894.1 glutaredoxin family protein [Candidatus Bipolaricaulota bacterium]MDW8110820.1 glutaredoxin family protein [Candidatus Bipolaricaulota bacterium]MDW8328699.1 glutaredoxin family protein [Candidatus Bipolaricaulota bacterium]